MEKSDSKERFIADLTRHQDDIYVYIYSLIPREDVAWDILQETNLVLWRKMEEFRPETNFMAWAHGIARLEVLAWRRDQRRESLVFDQDLIDDLAADAERFSPGDDSLLILLGECLKKLSGGQRDLLAQYYQTGETLKNLARKLNRSVSGLGVSFFRIRKSLAECIEYKLHNKAGK
jgi:RNA polymerase sigma-70 factor, ECF subfamily